MTPAEYWEVVASSQGRQGAPAGTKTVSVAFTNGSILIVTGVRSIFLDYFLWMCIAGGYMSFRRSDVLSVKVRSNGGKK